MATTYISRTFGTPTDNNKWTFSAWVKRSGITAGQMLFYAVNSTNENKIRFDDDDTLTLLNVISGSTDSQLNTTRKFRDTSAWYHIVAVFDSSNVTSADRQILYVNGVRETVFGTTNESAVDAASTINSAVAHNIGAQSSNLYFNGNMSHVQFVDGLALAPTEFGEVDSTSGIWKLKVGSYATAGNNGFHLKMEDSSNMDLDSSSNAHTFSTTGTLTATKDNPDNNFATINPLYYSSTGLLNVNLTATSTGNSHKNYHSTIAVDSGKWYAEMKVNSWNGSNNIMFGIVADSWNNINSTSPGDNFAGNASTGIGYGSDGQKIIANSASSYGNSFTTGDILGIAMDLDNNYLYFRKNNSAWENSGVPTSGSTGTGAIDVPSGFTRLITFSHYGSQSCSMNFGNGYFGTTAITSAGTNASGNGTFEYDVPTGYTALSTEGINT
jgi:hypothetical protein